MKKILLILFTLIASASIYGQVFPHAFPEDTSPSDSDEFYTQSKVGGINTARRMLLSTLRDFYLTDVKNSTLPQWTFDVATDATDPGAGIVKYNSPTVPTAIYVSQTNQQGADMVDIFGLLASGSVLYLQALDGPARYLAFNVTGAVDNGDWWTITGTVSDIGSVKLDTEDIGVSFYGGGGGGGAVTFAYDDPELLTDSLLGMIRQSSGDSLMMYFDIRTLSFKPVERQIWVEDFGAIANDGIP